MADTKTTGLTALTALDAADLVMVVDVSDTTFDAAGTNKKITKANLLKPTGADANTVTGTAGTDGNLGSWNVDGDLVDSTVAVADVLVESDKTGADTAVVSGTAGTSGNLATWNADGDLVDGPTPPSGTIVGTTDAQTLTNKTLTTPVISAISNTGTVTLPTATDTLVGRDTTDTLTNKTIDAASNTLSNIAVSMMTSGAATDGHVITADGAGGVAWEAAASGSGDFKADGTVPMTAALPLGAVGQVSSTVADGATAIAYRFLSPTFTTLGSKLVQFENNGDPSFYVTYAGELHIENYATSGRTCDISPFSNRVAFGNTAATNYFGAGAGREIGVTASTQYGVTLSALTTAAAGGFRINPDQAPTDQAAAPIRVSGAAARSSATTNIVGGNGEFFGGDGASGSAGNAHGGNAIYGGGTGYGTGHHGHPIFTRLADNTVADASLAAGQMSFWIDESGNTLTFKVKYADGSTVKTGTVALA